jgi:hypothetical protein
MLRSDVVEAAEQDRFKIYPIETIGQGIELLTGRAAGVRDPSGNFPAGTINGLVEATLRKFAKARKLFAADSDDEEQAAGEDK